MTLPLDRRAFLKLGGALGLATAFALPPASKVRIASAWPLPFPHRCFPNPDHLLAQDLSRFDLLVIPAYAAAELIQRGALCALPGSPGRAHDPEGTFTQPCHYDVRALPLASAWPDHPRLVVGAALWARGYSPNDSHPGHLAQIEPDLLARRLPAREGAAALLIEYDWVIPLNANREAALAFLRGQRSAVSSHAKRSAIPLMPLPSAARSHISQLWARLTTNNQ
jgi:hypothetical protein